MNLLGKIKFKTQQLLIIAVMGVFVFLGTAGQAFGQSVSGEEPVSDRESEKQARVKSEQEFQRRTLRRKKWLRKKRREARKRAAERAARESKNLAKEEEKEAQEEPSVWLFGSVGGSVFFYETVSSFEPDFVTGTATLGVEGKSGPVSGELSFDLGSEENVEVGTAFVQAASPFGLSGRLGRSALAGVSNYAANLNATSQVAGNADGAFLAFESQLPEDSLFSVGASAAIVNSFADDQKSGFGLRSANTEKGLAAGGHLGVSVVHLQGFVARQGSQIQTADDATTTEENETQLADYSLWEASLGLDFGFLKTGGFFSQKTLGPERLLVESATVGEDPLKASVVSENLGGGVTLTSGPVFTSDNDAASLSVGYTISTVTEDSATPQVDNTSAATLGYDLHNAAFALSFANTTRTGGSFEDEFTGETFSEVQRLNLDFVYNFRK